MTTILNQSALVKISRDSVISIEIGFAGVVIGNISPEMSISQIKVDNILLSTLISCSITHTGKWK